MSVLGDMGKWGGVPMNDVPDEGWCTYSYLGYTSRVSHPPWDSVPQMAERRTAQRGTVVQVWDSKRGNQ